MAGNNEGKTITSVVMILRFANHLLPGECVVGFFGKLPFRNLLLYFLSRFVLLPCPNRIVVDIIVVICLSWPFVDSSCSSLQYPSVSLLPFLRHRLVSE